MLEVEKRAKGQPQSARKTDRVCAGGGHGSVTGAWGLV